MTHENLAQSLLIKVCKHILGPHKKSLNITIMSELGTYPPSTIYKDSKLAMITYYFYLRNHHNEYSQELLQK